MVGFYKTTYCAKFNISLFREAFVVIDIALRALFAEAGEFFHILDPISDVALSEFAAPGWDLLGNLARQ